MDITLTNNAVKLTLQNLKRFHITIVEDKLQQSFKKIQNTKDSLIQNSERQ
jgi:hypothetical protein